MLGWEIGGREWEVVLHFAREHSKEGESSCWNA